jgi:hypothetical protein
VHESLEDKQKVIDDNLDTIDSSNQAISQLKSEKHKLPFVNVSGVIL